MDHDHRQLAREWLRALRGRRSQRHVSARLGYRSNVVYTWEAGTVFPPAHRAFQMAELVGVSLEQGLRRFFRDLPAPLRDSPLTTPAGVTRLMVELKGRTAVSHLARAMDVSRFTISRWLHGRAQPKLDELLAYVEVASLRLLDFVAVCVDPANLPSTASEWHALQRARRLGYENPFTHAVLRALETEAYRTAPSASTLSKLLGLPVEQIAEGLAALVDSGQARRAGRRLVPIELPNVDLRWSAEAAQQAKAFWADFAAQRSRKRRPGLFAYNVFAVSREDLERLEKLQRDFLREMRTLIRDSPRSEVVALANFQLFALED